MEVPTSPGVLLLDRERLPAPAIHAEAPCPSPQPHEWRAFPAGPNPAHPGHVSRRQAYLRWTSVHWRWGAKQAMAHTLISMPV